MPRWFLKPPRVKQHRVIPGAFQENFRRAPGCFTDWPKRYTRGSSNPVALHCGAALCRVAQEPNRNRKPEPSEPFFPKPKSEPEPSEPFFRNRNRNWNRPILKHRKTPFPRGTATGTARTVPPPNRNRTEPNRGNPDSVALNSPEFVRQSKTRLTWIARIAQIARIARIDFRKSIIARLGFESQFLQYLTLKVNFCNSWVENGDSDCSYWPIRVAESQFLSFGARKRRLGLFGLQHWLLKVNYWVSGPEKHKKTTRIARLAFQSQLLQHLTLKVNFSNPRNPSNPSSLWRIDNSPNFPWREKFCLKRWYG